ncbi:MAG: 50S ribosomal protein L23 [Nanoarchaeota archaeon]
MIIKPITTEKAVRLIDLENTLTFEVPRNAEKPEIKKEIESLFSVKIQDIRTHIQLNKKFVYVRLDKTNVAADVATKLGMI